MTVTKTFVAPPIDEREILRYAGCKSADDETLSLLRSVLSESAPYISYKVCFCDAPLKIKGDVCDFGFFSVPSVSLSKNLSGCERAIIFAATIGIPFDRLIAKYSKISPSRAVMLQAVGTERVEALCDAFCNDLTSEGYKLRPRFSPGYGDVPLDVQKQIFSTLDITKNISVFLSDSFIMTPSKSVTAFVGISK